MPKRYSIVLKPRFETNERYKYCVSCATLAMSLHIFCQLSLRIPMTTQSVLGGLQSLFSRTIVRVIERRSIELLLDTGVP
jgi:hypothetical protein